MAKKKVQKHKGVLIQQNQDGLEYSREKEGENLHETAAGIANKQKRELAKVDHTMTEYITFRKAFYQTFINYNVFKSVLHSYIFISNSYFNLASLISARMTIEEVELYKEELEDIRVKGKNCPKPIQSWAQCGLSTRRAMSPCAPRFARRANPPCLCKNFVFT